MGKVKSKKNTRAQLSSEEGKGWKIDCYYDDGRETAINDTDSKAVRPDKDKPPLCMVPWDVLRLVSEVYAFGAVKHGLWGFMEESGGKVFIEKALRHITRYFYDGEDKDPESGLHPIDHAVCDLLILREKMLMGTLVEDRRHMTRKQHEKKKA